MGYVFDFKDAKACEDCLETISSGGARSLEIQLMLDLLRPNKGESILDVGCGGGASILPLLDYGFQWTGIDPSPYMLDLAAKYLHNRADLHRGMAEDMPFDDNSFNHAILVSALEFVDDPQKALAEAFRVAKDRVFLGILNRYALEGLGRWVKGKFSRSIYTHARYFSIWELKRQIKEMLGDVPVAWRTVNQLPAPTGKMTNRLEQSQWIQKCPFGAYAGIVITLNPHFRTRPLTLKYGPKHTTGIVPG